MCMDDQNTKLFTITGEHLADLILVRRNSLIAYLNGAESFRAGTETEKALLAAHLKSIRSEMADLEFVRSHVTAGTSAVSASQLLNIRASLAPRDGFDGEQMRRHAADIDTERTAQKVYRGDVMGAAQCEPMSVGSVLRRL